MADFTMKAHDQLPSIQASLLNGDSPVDLTTAVSVKFIMAASPSGTVKVNSTAVIVDAPNGIVRYDWITADTNTVGNYQGEWQVTWPGAKQQSFPTTSYHSIAILADLDNA